MNLFRIDNSIMQLVNQIEELEANIIESGGIINDEIEVTYQDLLNNLEISKDVLKTLVETYYHIQIELIGDSEVIDKEIKRLNNLKKVKLNTAERIKELIKNAVLKYGDTGKSGNKVLKTELLNMFTRSIKSVEITNINLIPKKYIKYRFNSFFNHEKAEKIAKEMNIKLDDFNIEASKTDIKKDLSSNISDIDGAQLKENISLTIK